MTGYSSVLYDTQKGLDAFSTLVNFFSSNVNGGKLNFAFICGPINAQNLFSQFWIQVKINQVFSDYQNVSLYLQNTYGISKNDLQALGESLLYYSPQVGILILFLFLCEF